MLPEADRPSRPIGAEAATTPARPEVVLTNLIWFGPWDAAILLLVIFGQRGGASRELPGACGGAMAAGPGARGAGRPREVSVAITHMPDSTPQRRHKI